MTNNKLTVPSRYRFTEWQNIANNYSGNFFDPDAMRFFNSKILWHTLTKVSTGYLFITSERFDSTYPKKYTIRHISNDYQTVTDASSFQQFDSPFIAWNGLIVYARSVAPDYEPQPLCN